MGLLPLVSIVARPVKHARLVTALLKATALMRSKAQVHTYLEKHLYRGCCILIMQKVISEFLAWDVLGGACRDSLVSVLPGTSNARPEELCNESE